MSCPTRQTCEMGTPSLTKWRALPRRGTSASGPAQDVSPPGCLIMARRSNDGLPGPARPCMVSPSMGMPKLRALVVDDVIDVAQTIAAELEQLGFEAECAASGASALQSLSRSPVDL